jgi:DNA-binding MarR family transcriptional regulator
MFDLMRRNSVRPMAAMTGVREVMEHYPRIFFACHTRHVRDPEAKRLVSAHQASILDHLDRIEAITMMGLARHMGVTLSTMSLNIERLVRRGYVSRTRDPRDRRRAQLLLTNAGLRLREASSVLDAGRVRAMLAGMGPEQRKRGLEGLELLARAADMYMQTKPPRLAGIQRGRRSEK